MSTQTITTREAYLERIVEDQKRIINYLRDENDFLKGTMRNKALPMRVRQAAWAAREWAMIHKPEEDGSYKAYLPEMGRLAGVSAASMSRGLKDLAEMTGAIANHTERQEDKTILRYHPNEMLEQAPTLTPLKETKKHGGYHRAICEDCGSDDIVDMKVRTCRCCGKVIKKFEPVPVNPPPFQVEMTDEEPGPPPFQLETHTDDQPSLQSATLTVPSIPFQVEMGINPSTAPQVVVDSETEQQAAQLLVAIAGPSAEHIQMWNPNGTTKDKYTTVHRPLTIDDTLAHIRGEKTIGDTLKQDGELTRAACYDGDNEAELQIFKDAARLLAAVDFIPLLEPSPATGNHQGGGRLWIILDSLVDVYSLHQTLQQYAPMLKGIKESWPGPNTRTRLPGGKYREGDKATWCKLYDAHGQELSHEGASNARILLASQSSAELIIEYEKPEPARPTPQRAQRAGGVLGQDVAAAVIQEFNDNRSWPELFGKDDHGKYLAIWRGDRNPNVAINPDTDLAKDFSPKAWLSCPMDKYQVWCLIEGGHNWQEFKRCDLDERCNAYRNRNAGEQPVAEPMTLIQEKPSGAHLLDRYLEQMGR